LPHEEILKISLQLIKIAHLLQTSVKVLASLDIYSKIAHTVWCGQNYWIMSHMRFDSAVGWST